MLVSAAPRSLRVTGCVAGTGYLNVDLERGEIVLSRGAASILGVPFAHMPIAILGQFVLPGDRAHFDGLLRSSLERRPTRSPCIHLRSTEGGLRHIRIAVDVDIDATSTTRVTLILTDVTQELARQASVNELTSMLRAAEQMARIGHWRFRVREQTLHWSDEIYRIYGYEPGEVEPTIALAVASYHHEDRLILERAMATGEAWQLELRLVQRDGNVHWAKAKGAMLRDANNEVTEHFVFQSIDLEQKRDEHLHRLSEAVELTSEAVLLTDAGGPITWGNAGFRRLTGFSLEDCIGRRPGELLQGLQGPETDPTTVAFMKQKMSAREPFVCEVRNYTKAGEPHWIHLSVQPRFDACGQVAGFVSLQFDITAERTVREELATKSRDLEHAVFRLEQQKVELTRLSAEQQRAHDALRREADENVRLTAELQRLALTDALTALPNRRHFFEHGRGELSRARRYARSCSVVMIDIDLFKRINDRWGHGVGDRALCHVATVLRGALHRPADLLVRVGGEELGLLLPDTDEDGAIVLAERLRLALESAPLALSDDSISITASFGVSELSAADTSLDELLARADHALYRAKALGRNRCELEPAPSSREAPLGLAAF